MTKLPLPTTTEIQCIITLVIKLLHHQILILIILHLIVLCTHHLLLSAILGIQHHFWMMIFVSTRFHIDSTVPPTPAGDMLVPSVDCRIIYIQCNFYFHQMMKTRANGDVDRKGILSLIWQTSDNDTTTVEDNGEDVSDNNNSSNNNININNIKSYRTKYR